MTSSSMSVHSLLDLFQGTDTTVPTSLGSTDPSVSQKSSRSGHTDFKKGLDSNPGLSPPGPPDPALQLSSLPPTSPVGATSRSLGPHSHPHTSFVSSIRSSATPALQASSSSLSTSHPHHSNAVPLQSPRENPSLDPLFASRTTGQSQLNQPSQLVQLNQHQSQQKQQHQRPHQQSQQYSLVVSSGILRLLGPDVTEFPYSEQAFVETVKLLTEKERARQEYYRLELAQKNLHILQTAIQAGIPPTMIPAMCVGGVPESDIPQNLQTASIPRPRHRLLATFQHDTLNASLVPPTQYRFGGGATIGRPQMSPHRPNSPAKVGAQAVANLATPTQPYRRRHSRHYSLPADALQRSPIKARSSAGLNSPLGLTSQIFVRPMQAQPLKQGRGNQPTQELMTSLQHVIQFHHWKPEYGQPPDGAMGAMNQESQLQHKRHKLHGENMSVDYDVLMDTLMSEKSYPNVLGEEK